MEATIFRGWIYDYLLPHAAALKVTHPRMLRAIAATKKKNDRIDAHKIADCLRCNFLPECCMASTEIRERRRTLRYRNLLVARPCRLSLLICFCCRQLRAPWVCQLACYIPTFPSLSR